MDRVHAAVEAGRCVVGIGEHLLRDDTVLLALRDRPALPAVVLAGPVVPPTRPITLENLARAIGQPDGVLLLIEPEDRDRPGLEAIAEHLAKAPHKPTVVVVSRSASPLLYQFLFKGVPVQIEKTRGPGVLRKLPRTDKAEVEPPPVSVVKKASARPTGVRRVFVGRETEVEAFQALVGEEGGPIVLSGPEGVGRNTLLDHALDGVGLTRHEDVNLGRGAGFDTLTARLAEICAQAGASQLADVLGDGKATPVQVTAAAIEALKAAEGTSDQVLVVQPLEVAAGRELDFFRKDSLGTLVYGLMRHRYPLRIVFVGEGQPRAYDHDASTSVRRFALEGIKGRFFHEIFEAYHAPEFPREQFGPLSERLHGHPMAARAFAVAMKRRSNGLELLESSKFLRMESLADTRKLRNHLRKRIDKLKPPERQALATAAHFRRPATGRQLSDLGLSRAVRLGLIADGLLEACGTESDKRYRVHPLVRSCLRYREISDFDTLRDVAALYVRIGQGVEGVPRIAAVQEANRCLIAARRGRDAIGLKYPDDDPDCEAIIGMMRSKRPHFDLAQQRLAEKLKRRPGHADFHLLKHELLRRLDAKREAIERAHADAMEQAPCAEVFQDAATFYLTRRARPKAVEVLEKGVQVLPEEPRLKTRLSALLMREGRRNEALDLLQQAMDQAPMLHDAYGLLGLARFDEGPDSLEQAETLLREAVRLAPGDPVQVPRLVTVLLARARAMADAERASMLRVEARELLAPITRANGKSAEGFLLLARLERLEGRLDRAAWLLKQARKQSDRRSERSHRIRLESALLDLARGKHDRAEKEVRRLVDRDPGNVKIFVALSKVLEARQQLIPAHAELLRARERVAPESLDGQWVEGELARLQAAIEANAASLAQAVPDEPTQGKPLPAPPEVRDHARVVRRREGEPDHVVGPPDAPSDVASAERTPADAGVEAATPEAATPEAVASEPATTAAEGEAVASEPATTAAEGEAAPEAVAADTETPAAEGDTPPQG